MTQTKKNRPNQAAETNMRLRQIQEAIEKAKGNPKKEAVLLEALVDPAEATTCEGCE